MDIRLPTDIPCGELLSDDCTHCGWLRKEKQVLKFIKWQKKYCVIFDRCFYYYKNETSKKPDGKFPLYGFNKVKRHILENVNWSFILEPVLQTQKGFKFSAFSKQEMVEWMKHIKEEMLRANNRESRTIADGASDGSIEQNSLERIEETIYDEIHIFEPGKLSEWESSDSDLDTDDIEIEKPQGLASSKKKDIKTKMKYEVPVQVLPTRVKIGGKSSNAKQPMMPKLLKRIPGEGQPESRRYPYEDVDVLAGPSDYSNDVPKEYYESFMYDGDDKEAASKIIEDIAEDGVFLVRKSQHPDFPLVLVTYSEKQECIRKYKIFAQTEKNTLMYYLKDDVKFESMEDLVKFYLTRSICADEDFKLTMSYYLAQTK